MLVGSASHVDVNNITPAPWHRTCSPPQIITVGMTEDFMANESVMSDAQAAERSGLSQPISPARPSSLEEALDRLDVEMARRAQAEQALRETEERFRQFSERTGKFLWISDPQTEELLYVSPGYEQVWARTREAAYSSPEHWTQNFKSRRAGVALAENGTGEGEQIYQVAAPDGSVRWIRDRMFPVRDSQGNVQRMLGIAEDVTETKLLHDNANKTIARMKAMLAILPDLLFRVRKDGVIQEFHAGAGNPHLIAEANLVGKNVRHLLSSQLAGEAMRHLAAALRTREVQTFTCQYLLPDEVRDFEARGVACAEDEVLVLVRDVTERKRLEREIIEATSREQQRIGQDLHDSLGQHLTGITFMTKVLERKLVTKAPEEAAEAAEINRLVIQALAQTRNLARGLFPAELERNGLVAALKELTSTVEKTCNIRCILKAGDGVIVQDNVLATHVFRIAQEAVNNSVKHGKAKSIEVSLLANGDRLELSVCDDGSGFSPETKREGLGLRIMHYRARRIGGSLEVAATEKGGTRVTCLFRNKYESN
jgi:PAS domain S-box-containing protein